MAPQRRFGCAVHRPSSTAFRVSAVSVSASFARRLAPAQSTAAAASGTCRLGQEARARVGEPCHCRQARSRAGAGLGPGQCSALFGRLATRKPGPGARATRQQPGLMQPVSAAQARRAARPSESLQQRAVVFRARTAPDGARARPGIGRDAGAARGQNMCIWARAELAEPLRVPR